MAVCDYCGVEFTGRTKRARYCSDKHRVYASRRNKRETVQQQEQRRRAALELQIEQVRILWGEQDAKYIRRMLRENGLKCGEDCVKLILAHEAHKQVKQPVHA